MNYTTNYQLPTWVETDRIQMDDFNDMTDKLDTALGEIESEMAAQAASVVAKGNCAIQTGSYIGTGTAGTSAPNSLTFSKCPLLVLIMPQDRSGSANYSMMMIQGATWAYTYADAPNSYNYVTWNDAGVSWYGSASDARMQCNASGITYYYVALFEMTV